MVAGTKLDHVYTGLHKTFYFVFNYIIVKFKMNLGEYFNFKFYKLYSIFMGYTP